LVKLAFEIGGFWEIIRARNINFWVKVDQICVNKIIKAAFEIFNFLPTKKISISISLIFFFNKKVANFKGLQKRIFKLLGQKWKISLTRFMNIYLENVCINFQTNCTKGKARKCRTDLQGEIRELRDLAIWVNWSYQRSKSAVFGETIIASNMKF